MTARSVTKNLVRRDSSCAVCHRRIETPLISDWNSFFCVCLFVCLFFSNLFSYLFIFLFVSFRFRLLKGLFVYFRCLSIQSR